uniref:RRM domain-containing protein n=1 Tax=Oryza glumipatula TaxID=40148 RepID=A0A0D9ZVW3_9ORYZ
MSAPWWDNDYNGRTGSDSKGQESRVYVGNLPYRADERSLKDSFANYGAVSSEIAVDRETGRSRGFGFGFVSFQDSKSASDAIKGMNGQDIGGRNVTVQEAQPRSRR